MTRQRWTMAAVIVVAFAAVMWWLQGRGAERAASSAAKPAATERAGEAGGGGGSAARSSRRDPRAQPAASLAGVVRDAAGAALGGAWVCAEVGWASVVPDDDRREPRCTTAGADGAYQLDALWPDQWMVQAGAERHIPATWRDPATRRTDVRLRAGEQRTGVDFALDGGAALAEGVVLDITGGPVADAHVTVGSGGWSSRASCRTRSGADGTFQCWVAPGDVSAQAEADGYAGAWARGVAPGGKMQLYVTPESTLGGVVIDATTREPVAGAEVRLRQQWGEQGRVYSDADGRFRFTRLQPERYQPVASTPGRHGQAVESVLLGLAQSRDDVVIELHPATDVTGTVRVAAGAGADAKPGEGEVAKECWVELMRGDGRRYADSTRDTGTIAIDAVQPGTYEISIWCDRYVSRPPYAELVVGAEPIAAEWFVDPSLTVRGVVVDDAGAPVANADVWGRGVGGDPRASRGGGGDRTGKDGAFVLTGVRAGAIEIEASADGYADPDEPTKLDVTADLDGVRIVLSAGGVLDGIVVDEGGAPIGGTDIRARGERWGAVARGRDDGTFTMKGLRAGGYRVIASREGKTLRRRGTSDDDLQGERVDVAAGATANVRLVVDVATGRITGRVVDATGAPVTDAFVRAERESDAAGAQKGQALRGARWGWSRQPAVTDLDGRFAIDNLQAGTYTVLAFRRGGSEAHAEGVALGKDVTLTVPATGSFAGTVAVGDTPPRELEISIVDKQQGIWRTESFFMTGGAWTVRDLPAGTYDITAKAVGGEAILEKVALGEGEAKTGVALVLAATVTLTGRCVDAETGAPVAAINMMVRTVKGAGRTMWRSSEDNVSGSDGRFTLKDAPQGRLSVFGWPKDWGASDYTQGVKIVTVDADGVVDVGDVPFLRRRTPRNTRAGDLGFVQKQQPPDIEPEDYKIEVSAIRAGGPAAGSGLQVGDVIISVDGHDVRGVEYWRYQALASVPEGTTVAFGLARGQTVKIKAGRPE